MSVVAGSVTTGEEVVVGCTADTLNSVIINIQSINWTLCNVCPCEKQRVQKKNMADDALTKRPSRSLSLKDPNYPAKISLVFLVQYKIDKTTI